MSRALRDDLALAAYAVSLGYELRGDQNVKLVATGQALFNDDGIPHEALQFVIGDVHVWQTARGWRCSRLVDGLFEKPHDSCFWVKLKDALDDGVRNWRDR